MIGGFHFLFPRVLWGLLMLPFLFFFFIQDDLKRKKQFESFANKKQWKWIVPEFSPLNRFRKGIFFLCAAFFLILALARPQVGLHEASLRTTGLDLIIALDISNSMEVADVIPSRLKKAKHLVRSLLDHLDGDRVGIVAFAASSTIACPLTTDLEYVWDTVQTLTPKMIQNQGTDLSIALQTAFQTLERGAEETLRETIKIDEHKSSHGILLISDGEGHEPGVWEIAKKIKEKGILFYALGIGTQKGGPIALEDSNGNAIGFKKDHSGKTIVSMFHGEVLSEIAKQANGKYWNITAAESEVPAIVAELKGLTRGQYGERTYWVYDEWYQIPLGIALLFFFFEISFPMRNRLNKGIFSLIVFSFFSPLPLTWSAPLETYLKNKKGIELYEKGEFDEAEKNFGAAQARDPSAVEPEFNQGVIQFKKSQTSENSSQEPVFSKNEDAVDRAIEAFAQASRSAEQKKNEGLKSRSYYNLGNAFAKKSKLKEAAQAYEKAIESAQLAQDASLEYRSRKNFQLLIQEVKKQQEKKQKKEKKQQQQQQQKEKESSSEKQQKKEELGDQKNSDLSKKQENEKKQEETHSLQEQKSEKQVFHSKKMTQEDANRVMAELSSKEKQLREKLQFKQGKSKENEKDW